MASTVVDAPSPSDTHSPPGSVTVASSSQGSPSTVASSLVSSNVKESSSSVMPTNDEVEAVIKMATSTKPTPDGRPPPGKDTRTQLFVGNLPYRVRWQDLKDLFRKSGTVLRADVALSPDNRSRGYGTVLLASAEDAGRAVDMFNSFNWQGRVLEVRLDRLGVGPGEVDAGVTLFPTTATIGMSMGMGAGTSFGSAPMNSLNIPALNGSATQLNVHGLHVPAPQAPLPFVGRQGSGLGVPSAALGGNSHPASVSLSPAGAALSNNAAQNLTSATSPLSLNNLSPALLALHQQQQQQEKEREQDELLASVSRLGFGTSQLGSMNSLGNLSGGNSSVMNSYSALAELEQDRARSAGLRSLFVGNLPFHCQWQDLKDLFRQAGTILRADVSLGPDGRSRGFGTVTFASEVDAERAVQLFNGYDYNGRVLKVHYDKFCAQTPLLANIGVSPQPSSAFNSTPVQTTHSTLLQAAQLQQLVSADSFSQNNDISSLASGLEFGTNDSDSLFGFTSRSRPTTSGNMAESRAPLGLDPVQTLQDALQQRRASDVSLNTSAEDKLCASSISKSTSPRASSRSPFDSFNLTSSSGLDASLNISTGVVGSLAERRQKIPAPLSASSSRPTSGSGLASTFGGLGGLSINTGLSSIQVSTSTSDLFAHSISPVSPAREKVASASAGVYPGTIKSRKSFSNEPSPVPPVSASSFDKISSKMTPAATSVPESQRKKPDSSPDQQHPASTSPRQQHPAHPGPISLPPPAPLPAFPAHMHHHIQPMSPLMSPVGVMYPAYPLMSPPIPGPAGSVHSGYAMQGQGHVAMTPHGLPPITPSMPSFSFVPMPSPGGEGAPVTTYEHGVGPAALMSPPISHPLGPHISQQQHQHHLPRHVFQPFTPGPPTTMSPGAFWGRPGSHQHAPYLNPAVGSPVLIHAPSHFSSHQQSSLGAVYGSQPASPAGAPFAYGVPGVGATADEVNGYFPPVPEGYFPPISALGGVAGEILREGSTMTSESQNVDGIANAADRPLHGRSDSDDTSNSNSAGDHDSDELLENSRGVRTHSSSSNATSWRSSEESLSKGEDKNTAAVKSKDPLHALAGDLAAFRLGARPSTRDQRPTSSSGSALSASSASNSYAAVAAKGMGTGRPGSSGSSSQSTAGAGGRSASLGAEGGVARPAMPTKTHSDETGTQIKPSS